MRIQNFLISHTLSSVLFPLIKETNIICHVLLVYWIIFLKETIQSPKAVHVITCSGRNKPEIATYLEYV